MIAIIELRNAAAFTFIAVSYPRPEQQHAENESAVQQAIEATQAFSRADVVSITFPTKAVTLRQPWGWAIAEAGKDLENRSRRMMRPGWYFLHVGRHADKEQYEAAAAFIRRIPGLNKQPPAFDHAVRGGVIGLMKISEWVKESPSPWFIGPNAAKIEFFIPLPFCPGRGAQGVFSWKHSSF